MDVFRLLLRTLPPSFESRLRLAPNGEILTTMYRLLHLERAYTEEIPFFWECAETEGLVPPYSHDRAVRGHTMQLIEGPEVLSSMMTHPPKGLSWIDALTLMALGRDVILRAEELARVFHERTVGSGAKLLGLCWAAHPMSFSQRSGLNSHEPYFYILGLPSMPHPSKEEWADAWSPDSAPQSSEDLEYLYVRTQHQLWKGPGPSPWEPLLELLAMGVRVAHFAMYQGVPHSIVALQVDPLWKL